MKSANSKRIKKGDLRKKPAWLKRSLSAAKRSPLARLSEEEIGQLCEEIAEEAVRKRPSKNISP
jgi:hypothetical protein